MKAQKCTIGARHKWEWKKDSTLKNISISPSGARVAMSRRGIYKCECGALKYGDARSGL